MFEHDYYEFLNVHVTQLVCERLLEELYDWAFQVSGNIQFMFKDFHKNK